MPEPVSASSSSHLRLLVDAAGVLSGAATPLQVARSAVQQFERLLGTPAVAVFELRDGESLDAMELGGWVAGARDAWTTMPLDAPAPVADAARTRAPVWTESAAAWRSTYPHLIPMLDGYGYTGVLGLPMIAADEVIGAFGIGFAGDRELDDDERAASIMLAEQSALAMQRSRLLQVESEARRAAEQLITVIADLSSARTPAEVTAAIVAAATSWGADLAVVGLPGPDGTVHVISAPGATGTAAGWPVLPLGSAHPMAYAVRTGEPVWLARRSELAWRERSFATVEGAPRIDVAVPMPLAGATFGVLGMAFTGDPRHFSPAERVTIGALAAQGAQALDRARLHQVEHEIAETLQRGLLPDRLPTLDRLDVAARYLPASEDARAGGDWYDVLELDEDRVAIAVGDVVGNGPTAAALMGQLRTALAVSLLRGDPPGAALHQLDRWAARTAGARASTAACVVIDRGTGQARWASAGHPPPLVVGSHPPRFLGSAGHGPALGLFATSSSSFPEQTTDLPVGSTLVLYTDGLVERRGETLDQGLQRLADVAGASAAAGADPLAGRILTGLEDAAGADDIAIIVARLLPPELRALIPALPTELRGVRRDVARWAAASALPEDQLDDLQLAVGEAIANSVEHGYRNQRPGDVDYRLTRLADGSVEVLVQDWGAWRPPPGDPGHRGRGLLVMRGLSSSFDIDEQPSGTTVRFRIPAPVPPRPVSSTPPPVVLPGTGPGAKTATLSSTTRDDTLVLRPEGDLDLDGARSIGTGLVDAVRTAAVLARVELDLRATSYLSSAGVALLLRAVDAAHDTGREVHTLLDRDSGVARIIALTGADMLLRLQYVD